MVFHYLTGMRFKIFTVTKNEYDLIEDFIKYYGSQFGYENVIIIDNGSTNPEVLAVYQLYKERGLTVVTELGYQGGSQGDHFTKVMRQYKDSCDWLIGFDTDEFMVIKSADFSCDKLAAKLEDLLSSLDQRVDQIGVNTADSYCPRDLIKTKRPVSELTHFATCRSYISKLFYRSSDFIATSCGNHCGTTENNNRQLIPEIFYLHFHNTGYQRQIERAREINIGYDYISRSDDDLTAYQKLASNPSGTGIHRIYQLRDFLKRKLAIDSFFCSTGRLPTADELTRQPLPTEPCSAVPESDAYTRQVYDYIPTMFNHVENTDIFEVLCLQQYLLSL